MAISGRALTLLDQRGALSSQEIRTAGRKEEIVNLKPLNLKRGIMRLDLGQISSFGVKIAPVPLMHCVDPQWMILFP